MNQVLVKVDWLHPTQGGRNQLPLGDHFTAVGKFPHQSMEQWQNDAWSIRLDWLDKESPGGWYGLAQFAAPESPQGWLTPNSVFEIMEGPKSIGRVSIISTAKVVEVLLGTAA